MIHFIASIRLGFQCSQRGQSVTETPITVTPSDVLACMTWDGLSQVLSYSDARQFSRLTLTATHPKVRLLAELLSHGTTRNNLSICSADGKIVHQLQYGPQPSDDTQPVEKVAWWVAKCALPLSVVTYGSRWRGIALLLPLQRLKVLNIDTPKIDFTLPDAAALSIEELNLTNAPRFTLGSEPYHMVHLSALTVTS